MRYNIKRASVYSEKPCEEAYKLPNKQEIYDDWYIDIDSLEQLQEFIKKYGEVIISDDVITIYDTWVE